MRPVLASLVGAVALWSGAALAQLPGDSKCLDRCSDQMTSCGPRCGADQSCASRCMQKMDQCTQKCVDSKQVGKTGEAAAPRGKKCQNAKGKMVPCEDTGQFKSAPSLSKLRKDAEKDDDAEYQEKERERILKDPNAPRFPAGGG